MLEMKIISVKSEASREKSIPFNIKSPLPDEHTNHNSKLEAFVRLELSRKAAVELIDYDAERAEAMNEKFWKLRGSGDYTSWFYIDVQIEASIRNGRCPLVTN